MKNFQIEIGPRVEKGWEPLSSVRRILKRGEPENLGRTKI